MKKMTRRGLLRTAAVVAAGGGLASKSIFNALAQPRDQSSGIHFGVQLNAFPIDPKKIDTFLSTLGQVKEIGYQGFESSFRNVMPQFASPELTRHGIEATGLTFFGIHIFLPERMYDPATKIAPASMYESVARGGAALGAKHLILSGLPVSNEDELKRKVEALSAAGAFAKTVGITAAYHNHWPEFQSNIGGRSEIENLYAMTDPSVFSFVLDAGHAYRGGADVPAFIRAHSSRIIAFHLRDYKDGRLVSLGQGTFPIHQVADTIKQIGWKGWVENEEEREDLSKTGAEVILPAYKAMKEAFSK
jgi:sugar phosphate isomerase/epimerase